MTMQDHQDGKNGDASKLYKTELCRSWEETGSCRYGSKCQFAHGKGDLRPVNRHPKYKTEICRTFSADGTCPYGRRCRFIHAAPKSAELLPPPMKTSNFATRLLQGDSAANIPKSRLPIFRELCPAGASSLVY